MFRLNRRLPLPDLMLAQLHRRLESTKRIDRHDEAEEAMSELIVGWLFVGIIATFCLTLWYLGG